MRRRGDAGDVVTRPSDGGARPSLLRGLCDCLISRPMVEMPVYAMADTTAPLLLTLQCSSFQVVAAAAPSPIPETVDIDNPHKRTDIDKDNEATSSEASNNRVQVQVCPGLVYDVRSSTGYKMQHAINSGVVAINIMLGLNIYASECAPC